MLDRAADAGLEESGRRRRRVAARVRTAGLGVVAVPLAVSMFTAAPAQAAAVEDFYGDPTDIVNTHVGAVLPWLIGDPAIGGSKGSIGGWAWAHSGPTGTQAASRAFSSRPPTSGLPTSIST